MIAALIIVFREVFEAGLIIGIGMDVISWSGGAYSGRNRMATA